jgi:hypothetical protein
VTVTLYGKRVFVNEFRVSRFNHPGLSGWALNAMTELCKTYRGGVHRGEGHIKTEADTGHSGSHL